MEMVIYKGLSGWMVTTKQNYCARIQDARKITDCSAFNNPDEIIEYYCKWFNSKKEEFTVID